MRPALNSTFSFKKIDNKLTNIQYMCEIIVQLSETLTSLLVNVVKTDSKEKMKRNTSNVGNNFDYFIEHLAFFPQFAKNNYYIYSSFAA